jgi:hypothetical protein
LTHEEAQINRIHTPGRINSGMGELHLEVITDRVAV